MTVTNITTVGQLMSSPVLCAHLNQRITQLARLFFELNIHHLPVIDKQGELIGILSSSDVLKAFISKIPLLDRADEETINKHISVGELMTPDPLSVDEAMTIKEAAELFTNHNFQSLPVVTNGKLMGIVTTRDLIKLLSKKED